MGAQCGLLWIAFVALPCAAADDGLRQAVEKVVYRVEPSGHGKYRGVNRKQGLAVEFDAHSARLQHAQGNVAFRLSGYGYGSHIRTPVEAKPAGNANRLEYRRGELTEWYVNEAAGLEQGFTLTERPGIARPGEPLVIALAVEGELRPSLAPLGDAVLLQAGGRSILRYGGLHSWDASGRAVASRLDVKGREVRLIIEDRDAEYPLVVDPSWTLEQELQDPAMMLLDQFGFSVSLSGDTVLVGSANQEVGTNMGQGAAYVFVRSGTMWSVQQMLTAPDGMSGDEFGSSVALSGSMSMTTCAASGPCTAVIGAPFGNSSTGVAYVFVRTGTTWAQLGPDLIAGDAMASDEFGSSVSLDGGTAVIGALFHQVGTNANQGAAYVFVGSSSTNWTQHAELTSSSGGATDGAAGDEFGFSVSVSGDTALIGAPFHQVGAMRNKASPTFLCVTPGCGASNRS